MRKISILILTVALFGLLTACAAPAAPTTAETDGEGDAAASGDSTMLEFWMLTDEVTKPYFQSIVDAFNAENPETEIVMRTYANEAYKTAIQVAIGSDDPPDILFNWAGDDTGRFVREAHLLDLTPYAQEFGWQEVLSPAALNAFTYGDFLAAAPYSLEAKYYYYNTNIFDELGLSEPETFEDLLQICRTLRENDITPMAFGNQERWEGVHYLSIFNQKVVGEGTIEQDYILATPAEELFSDPNYAAAFQPLVEMQEAGCFADAVNSTTPDAALAQFFTEQTAMYYQGTWIIGSLAANEFEDYGMFRMPSIESGAGNQNYILMGPIGLEVSAQTEAPDAAARFVDFFINQENQLRLMEELNRLPVRSDVESENVPDAFTYVIDDLAQAEGATTWLDVILENSVSEVYLNSIQEVIAGTQSPEEAAAAIRDQALVAQERLGEE